MLNRRLLAAVGCAILSGVTGCGGGASHPADGGRDGSDGDALRSEVSGEVASDAAPNDLNIDVSQGGNDTLDSGGDVGVDTSDGVPSNDAAGDGLPDVSPPAMLTASVADRRQTSFQLLWSAPAASNGGPVAGYDVRVSRVPITSANVDDTAMTRAIPYSGMPSMPGKTDGMLVSDLNIEQGYYFAVIGKDSAGTRGTLMSTTSAVTATFLTTVLPGTGTDGIGTDLDGTGDFGGSNRSFAADGFSDLIVGGTGGTHVYVYFGTAAGYSATPSITITGATNFGQAVVNAGDLDGDGLDDIAVASPGDGSGKVYIFSRKNPPPSWGVTNAWPATLTDAQANYILTVDPTFAGAVFSIFRRALARLGNFDGTGSDDLAVGLRLHGGNLGSVLVVKGGSTFASATIPSQATTIEVDGMLAGGEFGLSTLGIGQFFPAPAGPALVVGAPLASAVYAFHGQAANGPLSTADADDSVVASSATDQYGVNLGFLGPLGASAGAITIASVPGKYVDLQMGTLASGPFPGATGAAPAATVRFSDSASGNSFGIVNLGSGIKGSSRTVSFLGDAAPDLILGGQSEAGAPIYIVNGALASTLGLTVDVAQPQSAVISPTVRVSGRLPSAWIGFGGATVIVDSNHDGHADFALGESAFGASGQVVVFY